MKLAWPWQSGVLDPHGPIGAAERTILLDSTAIMLAVIVPVIILTLVFAWWFRSGNPKATRLPDWSYSGPIEVIVWSIPTLTIGFLGGIAWLGSHDLDPRAALSSDVPPVQVQVVAMDWKWLFIYPDLHVASVNRLVVPAGAPISFELTSASVMNSFFAPQLGSMIYAMPGMATRLNLLVDRPGTTPGLSAQFSGDGFSDMRFDVVAVDRQGFEDWLRTTRSAGGKLDDQSYRQLVRPSAAVAPMSFGDVTPGLFERLAMTGPPAFETAEAAASQRVCFAPRARN
jgi:cytochrome o ubiquinol oxidase subunit 2